MKKSLTSLFHFEYQDNGADQTLMLMHGTGGTEKDLFGIVSSLKDSYNFLGLRGNVQENGMNRFFARLGDGIFDQKSITAELKTFVSFLELWCQEHNISQESLTFVGFSNGANMILSLAFRHPELVQRAALLHPMLPFQPDKKLQLKGKEFFVSYGETDPMVTADASKELIDVLQAKGAAVEVVSHPGEHRVVRVEVERMVEFLKP